MTLYFKNHSSLHHLCFSVTQNEGSQIKPQIQTIQQEIEKLLL